MLFLGSCIILITGCHSCPSSRPSKNPIPRPTSSFEFINYCHHGGNPCDAQPGFNCHGVPNLKIVKDQVIELSPYKTSKQTMVFINKELMFQEATKTCETENLIKVLETKWTYIVNLTSAWRTKFGKKVFSLICEMDFF